MDKNWETPIKNGQGHNGLGFLFKIVNIPYNALDRLCDDEDFVNEIAPLVNDSNISISADIVYDLLKKIAMPFITQEPTQEFKDNYKTKHGVEAYKIWSKRRRVYKDAMNQMCKQIYGDPNYWKNNLN